MPGDGTEWACFMVKQTGFITSDLPAIVKPTRCNCCIYCLRVPQAGDNLSAGQNQNRRCRPEPRPPFIKNEFRVAIQ